MPCFLYLRLSSSLEVLSVNLTEINKMINGECGKSREFTEIQVHNDF